VRTRLGLTSMTASMSTLLCRGKTGLFGITVIGWVGNECKSVNERIELATSLRRPFSGFNVGLRILIVMIANVRKSLASTRLRASVLNES